MSTQRELAAHYLRFWEQLDAGIWQMSTNTPALVRDFANSYPAGLRRSMVGAALQSIADGDVVEFPKRDVLLNWLLQFPEFDKRVESLLKQKNPPTTLLDLLHKTYRAEFIAIREDLRAVLKAELAKYA